MDTLGFSTLHLTLSREWCTFILGAAHYTLLVCMEMSLVTDEMVHFPCFFVYEF